MSLSPFSFDAPRQRPGPELLEGVSRDAVLREPVDHPTLVIAVKPHCDGCHEFIYGSLDVFGYLRVLLVCATFDDEWLDAPRPVYEAPSLLAALDVRSPPFYVLLLASPSRVVAEGIAFTSEQVASEIASALT